MSSENFNRWKMAEITVGEDQDLLPSLRGKTFEGSGVAIDYLGKENSGAVAYRPTGADCEVRPVATWTEDGTMAIVEARLGRGRIVLLGTPFYMRMKDEKGIWVNDIGRAALLDELLAGLGVPRDGTTNDRAMWAEVWRSKNGVFDLYPVARMTQRKEVEPRFAAEVSLRRESPVSELVEISALGHPTVAVEWKDGAIVLPTTDYAPMQTRVFVAPRAAIARSGLDWFEAQSRIWRALPALPDSVRLRPIPMPDDVLPAVEGWRMSLSETNEDWIAPDTDTTGWKTVKLGTFVAMGVPEDAKACLRRTVAVPAHWRGRRVNLNFRSVWSYGVTPQGRLWIDGEPARVRQPLKPSGDSNFTLDVTDQAKDGSIDLALLVDGTVPARKDGRRGRPSGVSGIFFLEAVPATIATVPLDGPWYAAKDVNVMTPVEKGEKARYTYLETSFTLPARWPAARLFLECPDENIQHVVLNDQVITVPMHSLDISGLVRRAGDNILRWVPGTQAYPEITRVQTKALPALNLVWKE
jgi:hypothetical protein